MSTEPNPNSILSSPKLGYEAIPITPETKVPFPVWIYYIHDRSWIPSVHSLRPNPRFYSHYSLSPTKPEGVPMLTIAQAASTPEGAGRLVDAFYGLKPTLPGGVREAASAQARGLAEKIWPTATTYSVSLEALSRYRAGTAALLAKLREGRA